MSMESENIILASDEIEEWGLDPIACAHGSLLFLGKKPIDQSPDRLLGGAEAMAEGLVAERKMFAAKLRVPDVPGQLLFLRPDLADRFAKAAIEINCDGLVAHAADPFTVVDGNLADKLNEARVNLCQSLFNRLAGFKVV